MMLYRFILILFNTIICFSIFGQRQNRIVIIAGEGIVYNNDSIMLYKSSIQQTCKILKIHEPKEIEISHWDNFDNWTSGVDYRKELNYKYFHFDFWDNQSEDSLKLIGISIKNEKKLQILGENGFELVQINPDIKAIYPNFNKQDYITPDGLNYILHSYGITFKLDKLPDNIKVIDEILIYKKTGL